MGLPIFSDIKQTIKIFESEHTAYKCINVNVLNFQRGESYFKIEVFVDYLDSYIRILRENFQIFQDSER